MKEIKLSNSDKVALVDDEDYQHVISFGSWHFNNSGYAIHRPYVEVDNIFLEGRGFLGI